MENVAPKLPVERHHDGDSFQRQFRAPCALIFCRSKMSVLLSKSIFSLFLIMTSGFALVKSGMLKVDESKTLSVLTLYVLVPCMIISSFQVEMTSEVQLGFLVAFIGSLIAHALFIALTIAIKRPLNLDGIERTSIICTNCGAFIVPLTAMVLGAEYTIYGVVYLAVLNVTLWTYGRIAISGKRERNPRKLFFNLNMICIYIGLFLFFTGIRLPGPVQTAASTVSSMVGPVTMIAIGMALGKVDIRKALALKRLPLVSLLRMLVFPLALLAIFKFTPLASIAPNGSMVLLVVLLGASAPSACVISQIAQVYGKDFFYASTISATTLFLSILTIPFLAFLYQL